MLYGRSNILNLLNFIASIKDRNFSIQTQYKFLKIKNVVEEEEKIIIEQKLDLIQKYADTDEDGNIITSEDGGIKIKQEYVQECQNKINEMNSIQIQLPDIYFSLDELESLNLTLGELELLEPFIKN